MRNNLTDYIRIQHMHDAICEIEMYISDKDEQDFQSDSMLQSACIRQLEIIGEAANHISSQIQDNYAKVGWREIKGMRNILIHEYFGVDGCIVWQIIQTDLPILKKNIEHILKILE